MKTLHKKQKIKYIWIIFSIVLSILLIEIVFLFFPFSKRHLVGEKESQSNISNYAKEIIEKCKNAPYHPTCYEKEVPKLLTKISMEDAFRVTKNIQDIDKAYPYCHVLAHKLAGGEVEKNPSKWKEVITRCPAQGMCMNGCLHGVIQKRFGSDFLSSQQIEKYKSDLTTICPVIDISSQINLQKASCYHGVGHVLTLMTKANIKRSTQLCNEIFNDSRARSFCYDGVFMQIFESLEPEDILLTRDVAPSRKEDVSVFCDQFTEAEKISCHNESWPLFFKNGLTAEGISDFCEKAEDLGKKRCYASLFTIASVTYNYSVEKMTKICSTMIEARRSQCFGDTGFLFVMTDYRNIADGVTICRNADTLSIGRECYERILKYSSQNFSVGSRGQVKLCSVLPEEYKNVCKKGKSL